MLVDGIKVFLVIFHLLITCNNNWFILLSGNVLTLYSLSYLYPSTMATANPAIFTTIFTGSVIFGIIFSMIYSIVIYPIMAVALGNMAFHDGEFGTAFRLSDLIHYIRDWLG